ncbi:phage tail tube protein [Clostridium formicaceticum]|uniref:Phage portal protein n=1 Tax=Clostridium formicaceticum TaxID=1497 RepID=A0AAC9RL69_9CLOT|nr:phage tail tube protein [Clostridium formicaceticum]AOY77190.1 phage portal protein [Clostridium formicaceticum]ARE87714.1 Phage-like element PBSX protein XkdM [Clostridium formicaceticum]
MSFNPDRAFYGSFSKLLLDGEWQTNANSVEATVEMSKGELNVMGDDWTRYKKGQKSGSGTFSGYKVTSKMIEQGFERFELIISLEDPEAWGHERVRLKNCMADSIQLANVTSGEIIEEETPFTFEGFELLDAVTAQ